MLELQNLEFKVSSSGLGMVTQVTFKQLSITICRCVSTSSV